MPGAAVNLALLAALTLGSAVAPAPVRENYGHSAEHDRCMSLAHGVTSEILTCNGAEIGRQDERLNAAYREAMSRLGAARKARLRVSERAWIKARRQDCDKEAEPEAGGTLYMIIHTDCFLGATAQRADYLEAYR